MTESVDTPDTAPDLGAVADGPLDQLREQLELIQDVEIGQRPALLEAANDALVRALSSLEEV